MHTVRDAALKIVKYLETPSMLAEERRMAVLHCALLCGAYGSSPTHVNTQAHLHALQRLRRQQRSAFWPPWTSPLLSVHASPHTVCHVSHVLLLQKIPDPPKKRVDQVRKVIRQYMREPTPIITCICTSHHPSAFVSHMSICFSVCMYGYLCGSL